MDIIFELKNKDDKKAYALFKELIIASAISNEYYSYFDEFVKMINHNSSYVRTRGFCLACAQARWDVDDKFKSNINTLFKMLHDDKPIAVRQCLQALHEVVLFKNDLSEVIAKELEKIDLSKYKETMSPLIKKDLDALYKVL